MKSRRRVNSTVGFLLGPSEMNLIKRRWPWISVAVLVVIVMLGFLAYRALDRAEKEFKESKWVRTSSGTVLSKELFRCHEPTCVYIGYGGRMEMKSGESQQRVYFQIDNFDQVGEPRRAKALQVEKDLVRMYGPRSTYAVDWYDRVEPGAKLYVRYQCFSDGRIEIVGIDADPSPVSKAKSNKALQLTAR